MGYKQQFGLMDGLSIITPHYNCFEGLKTVYECLNKQTSDAWEWLIIDDCSNLETIGRTKAFFNQRPNNKIRLIFHPEKANASVCRNIGLAKAKYNSVVFLDADDIILDDFVKNRLLEVQTFIVFPNYSILNEGGELIPSPGFKKSPLDYFLRGEFIWQTTSVLWSKDYLLNLGGFDPNLQRLQDIELAIRSLLKMETYEVLDNEVDFYYKVEPIRLKKNFVPIVCDSVHYLINKLLKEFEMSSSRRSYLKGYYYLCTKYLHRSEDKTTIANVVATLKVFKRGGIFNTFEYFMGRSLLIFYQIGIISSKLFLKFNRYFYKPQ